MNINMNKINFILISTFFLFSYALKCQSKVVFDENGITEIDEDSIYEHIMSLHEQGEMDECLKISLKYAQKGISTFQNLTGGLYEEIGNGAQAVFWYEKAAKQGSSVAQYNLGRIHHKKCGSHKGVVQNDEIAKKYYLMAINNSDSFGQAVINLYYVYEDEGNKKAQIDLLKKAIDEEIEMNWAPYLLSRFYKHDDINNFRYNRLAAENGNANAQYELGKFFEEGLFVEQDNAEATKWFQKSADQGNWSAQDRLGECYEKLYRKTLDERYLKRSLKYYYKSNSDDNESGLPRVIHLGEVSYSGNGEVSVEADNPLKRLYGEGALGAKDLKYEDWIEKVVSKLAVDSDVDVSIPNSGKKNERTFVLIIANENYEYEQYVPYAENDGVIFGKYCTETLGVPEKNVHVVIDASLNKMRYELDWLKQQIETQNGNNIIFYYSGHGIPDEKQLTSYLLPIDGFAKSASTGLSLNDVYRTLNGLNVPTTVLLDACFSGANRKGDMLVSSRGVAIKARNVKPQGKIVVLSACQGTETAYPYEEQKHGLFTYFILKKIKETSGNVTLGSLFDFVKKNVSNISVIENQKIQTPSVIASDQVENWRSKKL